MIDGNAREMRQQQARGKGTTQGTADVQIRRSSRARDRQARRNQEQLPHVDARLYVHIPQQVHDTGRTGETRRCKDGRCSSAM